MSEWISVKDKLPEHSYWVLVTDGENVTIGDYDVCDWVGIPIRSLGEITHWMPLPKPPESKT